MYRDTVERIFYELYADESDNEEIMFYYNKLYEDIRLFADPKYNKNDIESHFYGLICGFARAGELLAFRRGPSHAFRLVSDCAAVPELTSRQAQSEYEEHYGEQAKYAADLRAALESEGAAV